MQFKDSINKIIEICLKFFLKNHILSLFFTVFVNLIIFLKDDLVVQNILNLIKLNFMRIFKIVLVKIQIYF